MSSENLKIWDAVKSVDSGSLKNANIGGQQMLSVNGISMVQQITAAIGPIGKSWYYSIKEERYENTKPLLLNKEPIIVDGSTLWEQTHTVILEFFINYGEGWHSFPCFGHTPYRYMTKSGSIMVDQEVGKKSMTDALKKCLTMLGVAADVYSGALDDHSYAADAQDKLNIKKADGNAEKTKEIIDEMRTRMESCMKFIDDWDYARAMRSVKPELVFFGNRISSINPEISRPANAALSKIQTALEKKKQSETESKGDK